MNPTVENGQPLAQLELRTLLTQDNTRADVISQIAPHLRFVILRLRDGLHVMIRDKVSGVVLAVEPLRAVLAQSIAAGTMTHNAADGMPTKPALRLIAAELAQLAADVSMSADATGMTEAEFLQALPTWEDRHGQPNTLASAG